MTANFIHLRLHTEFSLVDSLVRIKKLVKRVADLDMPACGISDQCNFYGLIKFYKAAQGAGIKPIIGSDFWMASSDSEGKPTLLTLFAMNDTGYKNIIELISRAWRQGQQQGVAYIQREWVSEFSEGCIALSGGKFGDVGMCLVAGRADQAHELLRGWMRDFPNRFYLELQRTGRENDEIYIHSAVALADEMQCPVVATNDVRFINRDEFEVHEARVCISEGRALDDSRRERRYSEQQYLRSAEEMTELFSDIPEALENSLEIAKRCTVNIQMGKYFLPAYPVPEGLSEGDFFRKISEEGLERRLERILDKSAADYAERRKVYDDRLKFELDIIIQMGFPG